MNLYLEDGVWKVHNWIDNDVYPFGALYNWMQSVLDGDTNDDENEGFDLNNYAEYHEETIIIHRPAVICDQPSGAELGDRSKDDAKREMKCEKKER